MPNSPLIRKKRKLISIKSFNDIPLFRSASVTMDNFERIMANNKIWARAILLEDPDFFNDLAEIQTPDYMWIGCSDSRVPANEICGLRAG